jgi:hypothetical protein
MLVIIDGYGGTYPALRHDMWTRAWLLALLTACTGVANEDDGEGGGGKADGAISKDDFWGDGTMYFVRIDDWDPNKMTPESLADEVSVPGSEVRVYRIDPDNPNHCPDGDVGADDLVFETKEFGVRTSGNLTNGTPKSSYKIGFDNDDERMFDMRSLNLKSMWNDVSQLRESLAWSLFAQAGVRSSRHTYARLCINDRFYGLYSVVEQVDKAFLRDHFKSSNNDGNLYKAYWADIGPATLEHRGNTGSAYFTASNMDDRSYQLKTNDKDDDDPALQTYDDLAALVGAINGVGLPGGDEKFNTPAYKASIESIFNVKQFLRWASVNSLIGAWDNYWKTPANYYLYDSGTKGAGDEFMAKPYFTWLPWDYDNSFGIDYFETPWHAKNIVNWESAGSKLPLITNLLKNQDYLRYYLDHVDYMLDCCVNEQWVTQRIGDDTRGLVDRVRHGAYLEANGPTAAAHTGRQFTNDQVYWNGFQHHELRTGSQLTLGILHFVKMRSTAAKEQLDTYRVTHPRGSSGAMFPATREPLPN